MLFAYHSVLVSQTININTGTDIGTALQQQQKKPARHRRTFTSKNDCSKLIQTLMFPAKTRQLRTVSSTIFSSVLQGKLLVCYNTTNDRTSSDSEFKRLFVSCCPRALRAKEQKPPKQPNTPASNFYRMFFNPKTTALFSANKKIKNF